MLYDEANACALCPRLTGIPPHVVQLNQVAMLRSIVERTSDSFREILSSELNARSVGGEVFQANEILQEVRRLSQEMQHVINTVNNPLEAAVVGGDGNAGGGAVARVGDDDQVVVPARREQPLMYIWGGRLHNLPENFVLPKMNLQTLIVYWFCGSKHPLVPALKNVKSWDFKNPKTMKVTLSQMRVLMSHVLRGYEAGGHRLGAEGIATPAKATSVYEATRHLFMYRGTHNDRRHSAFTWKTVYNDLQRNKFKFVGEEA
jgi:hypothetical protein